MKDPKLIALDIGNVCVSIHPERLTKKNGIDLRAVLFP